MIPIIKCLSVRQPWAWLILCDDPDGKDVENRTWYTHYRGPLLIHAAKTIDAAYMEIEEFAFGYLGIDIPSTHDMPRGAIVAQVELVDCVKGLIPTSEGGCRRSEWQDRYDFSL